MLLASVPEVRGDDNSDDKDKLPWWDEVLPP